MFFTVCIINLFKWTAIVELHTMYHFAVDQFTYRKHNPSQYSANSVITLKFITAVG